jgi:hypothetical protein
MLAGPKLCIYPKKHIGKVYGSRSHIDPRQLCANHMENLQSLVSYRTFLDNSVLRSFTLIYQSASNAQLRKM